MPTSPPAPAVTPLEEFTAAWTKRQKLADQLAQQDRYVDHTIREARTAGVTWQAMADLAGTSDVAILKRARRPAA